MQGTMGTSPETWGGHGKEKLQKNGSSAQTWDHALEEEA